MTNHLQLPQDTLDRLAMLEASQEERDAALAKVVVISKDDLYRILSRRASSQDIDEDWQEIMQAGTIIASQPDRPDGDGLRIELLPRSVSQNETRVSVHFDFFDHAAAAAFRVKAAFRIEDGDFSALFNMEHATPTVRRDRE